MHKTVLLNCYISPHMEELATLRSSEESGDSGEEDPRWSGGHCSLSGRPSAPSCPQATDLSTSTLMVGPWVPVAATRWREASVHNTTHVIWDFTGPSGYTFCPSWTKKCFRKWMLWQKLPSGRAMTPSGNPGGSSHTQAGRRGHGVGVGGVACGRCLRAQSIGACPLQGDPFWVWRGAERGPDQPWKGRKGTEHS